MKTQMKTSKKQRGVTMVEYAIMLALIAVVCIGIVTALGENVESTFSAANTALEGVGTGTGT